MTAITPEILLESTGRENGPDFMLKVDVPVMGANSVINANSNITEVLNVIAYLCNNANRSDGNGIELDQSVPTANHGQHVLLTGIYATANTGNGQSNNTLWAADLGGATTQMIDLDTFQSPVYTANHIPVGILARKPVPGALGNTFEIGPPGGPGGAVADLAIAAGGAGPIAGVPLTIFSNAIKQMINILEHTRKIFGPKGWTSLFNKVKGGGAKNHAKRTHRQHRRRYSSKQY